MLCFNGLWLDVERQLTMASVDDDAEMVSVVRLDVEEDSNENKFSKSSKKRKAATPDFRFPPTERDW